ncbi:MAG: molybdenum cofactor biosynthesis protein MoaE [Thermoplasmata archaeon]
MIARVQDRVIQVSDFLGREDYGIGAVVTFIGIVRRYEGGRELSALHYEADEAIAEEELSKIINEAKEKYRMSDAVVIHRIGSLSPGEISLFVKVISVHRKEGFEACEYIVDELKRRVPIWKKDIYVDGSEKWH